MRKLYGQLRNRGIIQYFSPYASADLNKMASSFNKTVPALENELTTLILDGQIQARIDSHNKILYAKNHDQRCVTFEKSLKMGENYERRARWKWNLKFHSFCFAQEFSLASDDGFVPPNELGEPSFKFISIRSKAKVPLLDAGQAHLAVAAPAPAVATHLK